MEFPACLEAAQTGEERSLPEEVVEILLEFLSRRLSLREFNPGRAGEVAARGVYGKWWPPLISYWVISILLGWHRVQLFWLPYRL
ncbi:hypothetical protein E2320_001337 [Naja naja]|nr:hypothetical protein E2320_001337 [Naja naja]